MRDTEWVGGKAGHLAGVHLQGDHRSADQSCPDWTLLPGQLDCRLDGFEVETGQSGNCLHLHKQDGSLTMEGRTGTPLFCQLDEAVRENGEQKTFRIGFYDGMVRLEGPYRMQHFDRARLPEEGQALQFQAEVVPVGEVRLLVRPCSGHPDFGLWRNPALDLLEYWWRDSLVTAVELEQNGGLSCWGSQVVAYLEENASASHAAVTFLAQLRRIGAVS